VSLGVVVGGEAGGFGVHRSVSGASWVGRLERGSRGGVFVVDVRGGRRRFSVTLYCGWRGGQVFFGTRVGGSGSFFEHDCGRSFGVSGAVVCIEAEDG
jgi:hypothetical protein